MSAAFAMPDSPATPEAGERRDLVLLGGAAAAVLALCAVLFVAILGATGGRFSYTLDDAYIHLSMAEQILRGGYGVNAGEPASASSSALFPYLDAAGLALGLGQWAALAITLPATAASGALLARLAQRGGLIGPRTPLPTVWAATALGALALNLPGLAFSGMEHSLHVALALAALLLVLEVERGGGGARSASWTLAAVLAITPLVRFEGLAMLGAGALVLTVRRRPAPAIAAVVVAAAGIGLFLLRLHAMGLPWTPSSILVKAGQAPPGLAGQFMTNILRHNGLLLLTVLFPALSALNGPQASGAPRLTVGFACAVVAAQLAVGPFGWQDRYEAYALAIALGLALLLWGGAFGAWIARGGPVRAALAAVFLLLAFSEPALTSLEAPAAARSIRLQQQEMRRFVVDSLRAPVAVNDLGWVSWRNDLYVLDLWGLGSETARRARLGRGGPAWMDALAQAHGVKAAMIYDTWLEAPAGWIRLGELRARVPMTFGPVVSFYAVRPEDAPAVRAAVAAWAKGLPAQAYFAPQPSP